MTQATQKLGTLFKSKHGLKASSFTKVLAITKSTNFVKASISQIQQL
jgi:hypothetical protein